MKNADALIRHANLVALKKSSTELAALTATTSAYWSDMLRGKKSFGEKAARKLEEALGLARGGMDEPEINLAERSAVHRQASAIVNNVTKNNEHPNLVQSKEGTESEGFIATDPLNIPLDMPFSNRSLSRAIILLGAIAAALPMDKRMQISGKMRGLVAHPEAAAYIADEVVEILKIPDSITSNAQLDRWLSGNRAEPTETRPADLDLGKRK